MRSCAMETHSKKWKTFIVSCAVLLLTICSVIAFVVSQPQLVTGKRADLQHIVILEYDYYGNAETLVTDKAMMDAIYRALYYSFPFKRTGHGQAYFMLDPLYIVELHYSDREETVSVYRDSATRFLGQPDAVTQSTTDNIARVVESALNE